MQKISCLSITNKSVKQQATIATRILLAHLNSMQEFSPLSGALAKKTDRGKHQNHAVSTVTSPPVPKIMVSKAKINIQLSWQVAARQDRKQFYIIADCFCKKDTLSCMIAFCINAFLSNAPLQAPCLYNRPRLAHRHGIYPVNLFSEDMPPGPGIVEQTV